MNVQVSDIVVDTGQAQYPIRFVAGAAAAAAAVDRAAPRGRLIVISDSHVAPRYLQPLLDGLHALGRNARGLTFAAGEASKTIETVTRLWSEVFADAVDRNDTIVALGGGVAGDMAGFVAATTMRGIRFVQVPTTMLAMSDAAIGGKTGINVPAGKNLVGAFHQPAAVICWTDTLESLDRRELASGMAEVIKSAIIAGPSEVQRFREAATAAMERDHGALRVCAEIGARLKASLVSEDVLERGVRSYLNLGHTFGHAIEHASGYGAWTHGEAVAAGMVIAARYSVSRGHAQAPFVDEVRELCQLVGLPIEPPPMSLDEWLGPIFRDKKRVGESVKLILATGPGGVFGQPTSFEELRDWMARELATS